VSNMGWKNWPSWLKGGIIFSIIYIVLFLTLFKIDDFGIITFVFSPGLWLYGLYVLITGYGIGMDANLKYTLFVIISILCWFIIGVIIGWIVGKIRNRNK